MNWLARLKNRNVPGTDATKPTEPGFIGFVASIPGFFEKSQGDSADGEGANQSLSQLAPQRLETVDGICPTSGSANQKASGTDATKPTKTPSAPPDPNRWCWPASDAMNLSEIDIVMGWLARFTDKGLTLDEAEALADRLVLRDREGDDRRSCFECAHLQGSGSWKCGNWRTAGVAVQASDAALGREFALLLQRCDGFNPMNRGN